MVLLTLLVLVPSVYAEDTAAVLAVMPTKQAELRYLKQLCDRAQTAVAEYEKAIHDLEACPLLVCPLQEHETREHVADILRASYDARARDYQPAAAAFAAKRNTTAPACDAASAATSLRLTRAYTAAHVEVALVHNFG